MIYVYVFAISMFFCWLSSRSKDKAIIFICSAISILIPSILGGLRAEGIGFDTKVYGYQLARLAESSATFQDMLSKIDTQTIEPGFMFICYYSVKILGHQNASFFAYQLITLSCVYIGAYRHRKIVPYPLIFFIFLIHGYAGTLSQMRQCMAASIMFLGLWDLENRRYFKFLFYVIFASLFHRSSLAAIPMFIMLHWIVTSNNIRNKNKFFMIFAVIIFTGLIRSVASFIVNSLPFFVKYRSFVTTVLTKIWSRGEIIFSFGVPILFTMYQRGSDRVFSGKLNGDAEFFRVSSLFTPLWLYFLPAFHRLFIYYHYLSYIALASVPYLVKEKTLRMLIVVMFFSFLIIYWYQQVIFSGLEDIYPYRSIFD